MLLWKAKWIVPHALDLLAYPSCKEPTKNIFKGKTWKVIWQAITLRQTKLQLSLP